MWVLTIQHAQNYNDVTMGAIASQFTSVDLDYLLNHLFRCRLKKASKLRYTGLCEGNSPVTGEFPVQKASNTEMSPFIDIIM